MAKVKNDERYITVEEAEAITGRKAATWRRDIFMKKIAVIKFGRLVRIPMSEIERLVKEGYRAPVVK